MYCSNVVGKLDEKFIVYQCFKFTTTNSETKAINIIDVWKKWIFDWLDLKYKRKKYNSNGVGIRSRNLYISWQATSPLDHTGFSISWYLF